MIPEAYIPSLVALGCGVAGALVGLFIGFVPEPHVGALRRARRSGASRLREGDFVCIEGRIVTPTPLVGLVSQQPIALQHLEHGSRHTRNRDRQLQLERDEAVDLTVRDQEGAVAFALEEGVLITVKSFHGTARTMGSRWKRAMPDATDLVERSIAVGAEVLLVGVATKFNSSWTIGGRDAFLTDVPRAELLRKDSFNRAAGLTLVVASLIGSVIIALQLRP